jgi:hypothetical protein
VTFGKFLIAIWSDWLARMSGPLTVPFTIAAFFVPGPAYRALFAALAVMAGLVTCYRVWATEYDRAEEAKAKLYDGRPIIVLEVLIQPLPLRPNPMPGERYRAPEFSLRNVGQRTARFVKIEPITSRLNNYTMHFEELVALEPGSHRDIGFTVNDSRWSDGEMAWKFLTDNPLEAALVSYDTPIRFRDAGESVMEDVVRLAFDIESKVL